MEPLPSLVDLPAEVLCHIVGFLGHPRDVAACAVASPALGCVSPLDVAASYYRGLSESALHAGLPLHVARALFERWRLGPECRHVVAAAAGGRAAVLAWVCCHIKQHGGPFWDDVLALEIGMPYTPRPDQRTERCIASRAVPIGSSCLIASTSHWQTRTPVATTQGDRDECETNGHANAQQEGLRGTEREPQPVRDGQGGTGHVEVYNEWASPSDNTDDDGLYAGSSNTYGPTKDAFTRCSGMREGKRTTTEYHHPSRSRDSAHRLGGALKRHPRGSRCCLLRAAAEAARLGRVDTLRYLTTTCPLTDDPPALLEPCFIIEAARQGALSTVAYAHDRWSRLSVQKGKGPCRCPKEIGDVALLAGQYDILRWMHAVGCRASPCNMKNLARAIANGDHLLVDVITAALNGNIHGMDHAVDAGQATKVKGWDMHHALAKAVDGGHLRALAIAHARGLAPITTELLSFAASWGRLDVLWWAAGETVPGIGAHLAPPAALPWHARDVVWAAARPDEPNTDVLRWLADRPETRGYFDVFMQRTLVAHGCYTAAIWMHDVGLVSLASWNSLETAVRSSLESAVEAIIDRGAACSPLAMAIALDLYDAGVIALLCERYGHADLAEGVRMYTYGHNSAPLRWVRDNVPEVPVSHILCAGDIFSDRARNAEDLMPTSPALSAPSELSLSSTDSDGGGDTGDAFDWGGTS